ncbi:MAG: hypothetical protein H5T69_21035, partial [Chloroflexi bacterium]|nr:hypothetical protein [Chloroflexota bacterium]
PIPSLSGKTFVISFSQNGSISAIKKGKTGKDILPLRGNLPLWEISFSDGSTLASNNIPISQIAWEKRRDGIAINYKSELADVLAMFSSGTDGVELSFILHPKSKTILSLRSPILNFPPEAIEKIYVPEGLGLAFTRNFFTVDMGLTPQPIGDEGLRSVVGEGCVMRPVADEPVPIELTEMGRRWLGEDVGKKLVGHRMVVNRP